MSTMSKKRVGIGRRITAAVGITVVAGVISIGGAQSATALTDKQSRAYSTQATCRNAQIIYDRTYAITTPCRYVSQAGGWIFNYK